MPAEFTYKCALASGLHARPCSRIADIAGRFSSSARLVNSRNQRSADLRSVLSLISADVLLNDDCHLSFSGADESAAAVAVRMFLETEMRAQEEAAAAIVVAPARLPRALRLAGVPAVFGQSLSRGFAEGILVTASGVRLPATSGQQSKGIDAETAALYRALALAGSSLSSSATGITAAISDVHRSIVADPTYRARIVSFIEQGSSAPDAVLQAARSFADELLHSQSTYIRERAVDIEEVSLGIYQGLGGEGTPPQLMLTGPTILFAERLGAQELLKLDRALLQGIIFAQGQTTSHAVILARSLGVPAICAHPRATFAEGDRLILDGTRGYATAATPQSLHFYDRERALEQRRRESLQRFATHIATPIEGTPIEVAANVSSPEEAETAFAAGCDGIGLFRTEMLFVGRSSPPSEGEQFAAYSRTLKAAQSKPVILRTFDVGGDKPAPFLQAMGAEAGGHRGILIYKEQPALIHTQLRAMLRASAYGTLRIMVPLVATADDIRWVRSHFDAIKTQLAGTHRFDSQVQLGVMVELPEAAAHLDAIAGEADFFSIGTNDLAQYFFRADRTSTKLDMMSAVRRPEFLRLLHQIAIGSRTHRKWLGMCGEMAGDPRNLPLLIGLGLDELSLAGTEALVMKRAITTLHRQACQRLLEQALAAESAQAVEALLDVFSASAQPLLSADLIVPNSGAADREEAIRELAELLHFFGRAPSADFFEDALWDREATYPTDMGLGFALPHCKSESVAHNSVAVLHLQKPFLWSDESTVPVRAVIMLAMKNEPGAHMQVLSKLARRLMDDEFREQLFSLVHTQPAQAVQLLSIQVGISQEAS